MARRMVRIAIYVVGFLLLVLVGMASFLLFVPAVGVYAGSVSPHGRWVALLENVQYGLVTGPSDDVVVIRPLNGWFAFMREKEVFKIDSESSGNRTTLQWQSDNVLTIRYPSGIPTPIRIDSYGDLRIAYEPQPSP